MDKVVQFRQELAALCERFGYGLHLGPGDDPGWTCYECGGGKLFLIDRAEGGFDVSALEWYDLAAEKAKDARQEAEAARIQRLWEEQTERNTRLGAVLLPVFDAHQTVFWYPHEFWGDSEIRRVRALPFTEDRWLSLVFNAKFEANPLRSHKLAERQLTPEHYARLPAFWRDAERVMREVGLVPVPFGSVGIDEEEPDEDAEFIHVSPRFDDPLPRWLYPKERE